MPIIKGPGEDLLSGYPAGTSVDDMDFETRQALLTRAKADSEASMPYSDQETMEIKTPENLPYDMGTITPGQYRSLQDQSPAAALPELIGKIKASRTSPQERRLAEYKASKTPMPSVEDVPQNLRTQLPEEASDVELTQAQNTAGWGKLASMFGDAGAKIGTGYTGGSLGVKTPEYDKSSIEAGGKLGELPLSNLLQKRDEDKKRTERARLALEFKELRESSIPGTDKAKRTYEYVKDLAKRLGEPSPPDNLSAKEYGEYISHLEKSEAIKARQAERSASLFLRNQALQEQIDKKNRMSDKQVGDISSQQAALDLVDNITQEKSKFDTGPLAGRTHALASMVGMQDADKARFKADVQSQLVEYIRKMSGTAVGKHEIKNLEGILPTLNDNDEVFMSKIDALKRRLKQNLGRELQGIKNQGKAVSAYESYIQPEASERKEASAPSERIVRYKGKRIYVDSNNKYIRDAE